MLLFKDKSFATCYRKLLVSEKHGVTSHVVSFPPLPAPFLGAQNNFQSWGHPISMETHPPCHNTQIHPRNTPQHPSAHPTAADAGAQINANPHHSAKGRLRQETKDKNQTRAAEGKELQPSTSQTVWQEAPSPAGAVWARSRATHLALVVVGDVQGSDNDGRGHQIGKEVAVLRLLPGSSRVALFPLLIKRGAPVAILIPLLLELPAVWRAFIVRKGYRL